VNKEKQGGLERMKKWFLVGISLLLIFAVAGCGKGKSVSSDGKQMVTMWVHVSDDSEEGKVYKKRVDAFNKKYASKNVKAKIEFIPRSGNG